jgi:hypothetical protein
LVLSGWLLLIVLQTTSQAQVKTAITPDSTMHTTVLRHGNVYTIQDGTQRGPKLPPASRNTQ